MCWGSLYGSSGGHIYAWAPYMVVVVRYVLRSLYGSSGGQIYAWAPYIVVVMVRYVLGLLIW